LNQAGLKLASGEGGIQAIGLIQYENKLAGCFVVDLLPHVPADFGSAEKQLG